MICRPLWKLTVQEIFSNHAEDKIAVSELCWSMKICQFCVSTYVKWKPMSNTYGPCPCRRSSWGWYLLLRSNFVLTSKYLLTFQQDWESHKHLYCQLSHWRVMTWSASIVAPTKIFFNVFRSKIWSCLRSKFQISETWSPRKLRKDEFGKNNWKIYQESILRPVKMN